MNKSEKKDFIMKRFASMLLDHFCMSFIMGGVMIILGGICFLAFKITNTTTENLPEYFPIFFLPIILLLFSIYFNKDGIKGKSPAKRIIGFIVVENESEKVASPIKAVLRNITLVLWPLEVIVTLFSPQRRIGDYIAGTKVIRHEGKVESEFEMKSLMISVIIGILYIIPIMGLQFLLIGLKPFEFFGFGQ